MSNEPSRGEIWLVNLEPVVGHEQGGRRPCLVVTNDTFNHGPASMVLVVPITAKDRRIPIHVRLEPPEGGMKATSFLMPQMIRAVSQNRLVERWGIVSQARLAEVEKSLRVLMNL